MENNLQKINITTKKGNLSAVIHYPDELTEKLAILTPGYLDTKDYAHLIGLADALAGQGYTVVRYDPLGTWESGGTISDHTISKQLQDIRSIIEFMLGKNNYDHILLGGHSRGGLVSILYAVQDPRISSVLSIMSPYSLVRTVNADKIQQWKKEGVRKSKRDVPGTSEEREFNVPYSNLQDAEQYNALDEVGRLHVPLILVAGEKDDLITPAEVKMIYDKANEPKKMLVVEGIGHGYRRNSAEIQIVNNKILELIN
jgi:uncharacterized protein